MALTVELLKRLIASLRRSEDTEAALNFLKQSDLTKIVPAGNDAFSVSLLGERREALHSRGMIDRIAIESRLAYR